VIPVEGRKMPQKPKINLEKVKAALNTLCTKCGYAIPPDRVRRIDFQKVECPECREHFIPADCDAAIDLALRLRRLWGSAFSSRRHLISAVD
jgi:hypothetical protein